MRQGRFEMQNFEENVEHSERERFITTPSNEYGEHCQGRHKYVCFLTPKLIYQLIDAVSSRGLTIDASAFKPQNERAEHAAKRERPSFSQNFNDS
jgi:hypothetical protein